jgi:autotransporter-associated beta strand protein
MTIKAPRAILVVVLASMQSALAGSATWNANPQTNQWQTAANWTPQTVPNSDSDTATFGSSNTTNVSLGVPSQTQEGSQTFLDGMIFADEAGAYIITLTPDGSYGDFLVFDGAGVTNNSGVVQNIVAAASGDTRRSASIGFNNDATAGENMVYTAQGGAASSGDGQYGAPIIFHDQATAASATFINLRGTAPSAEGGGTVLYDSTSAQNAVFINNPATISGAYAGVTLLNTSGSIGNSTFICNPATVNDAEGGWMEMLTGISAGANFIANGAATTGPQAGQLYIYGGSGYATFTGNGGTASGAEGGLVDLFTPPNSIQTLFIAQGGTNGGLGGDIVIEPKAVVDQAQFQLMGDGLLDVTKVKVKSVTVGSLQGDGLVSLANKTIEIGNNNLATTFAGTIQGSGSITKIGTGTLILAGSSSYTGGTTLTSGTLAVTNSTGSATGSGAVKTTGGTFGGNGFVAGNVIIGDGVAAPAYLKPNAGVKQPSTLTISGKLTLQADGVYICAMKAKTKRTENDEVVAKGVIIEAGAQFNLHMQGKLKAGTTFTVISNTASTPISGTFANLADGALLTVGNTKLQASYEGGDGNDLTLTVVQ